MALLAIWAVIGQYRFRSTESWSYRSDLQAVIERALDGEEGQYGVAIKHLVSGEEAVDNANHQFAAASLYKLAVFYAAYLKRDRGELSFEEVLDMTPEAGVLTEDEGPSIPIGGVIGVADALYEMITVSDNSSAILLLQRIGPDTVNALASALGLGQTEVGVGDLALTSPQDILVLLEHIYRGGEPTAQAREEMICTLLQQTINDRLPRYLPSGTPIAHKTGNLGDVIHDAGIVYAPSGPYAIVVMAEEVPDSDRGAEAIARLSKAVYDYFASRPEKEPYVAPPGSCEVP